MSTTAALASPAPRLVAAAASHPDGSPAPPFRAAGLRADGSDPRQALTGAGPGDRILVLGWIGSHRDARDASLRSLWDLEEAARATGAAVLVLRLAPLVGERSPLTALLGRRPRLDSRVGRALVQPVLEDDVVTTIARAAAGRAPWSGWYELCGPDVLTVAELADLAAGVACAAEPAWEPPPEILRAQGLAEHEPWAGTFGITPRSPVAWVPDAAGARE